MATLKEHQNAMVDLLANGSAIPASAARLAHALHDVLGLLLERDSEPHRAFVGGQTATAAFSGARPKGMYVSKLAIDNLRAELANVTSQRDQYKARCESLEVDLDRRRQKFDELKSRCMQLETENDEAHRYLDEQIKQKCSVEKENNELKAELIARHKKIEELKTKPELWQNRI